jgi:two-component system sensor histidine kinase/response regulator
VSKHKILIVDDEKTNCNIISGLMLMLGVPNRKQIATFAYDGEQAVKSIQDSIDEGDIGRYNLILMDCNMPFMDGYAATTKIREILLQNGVQRKDQPMIVAITGHVEQEYVSKALKSGMNKVFQKPLPIASLGELLIQCGFIREIP